ncbi:SDR family NAD(P)-dependent oxidoreductase [Chelatococcus sp. SYSU_G07232]|uniref:SDR family NAD(P)-dependent oxidoreductase n=1 Tax=Chelatococcus albus TaxID=3047466 RepID=A0ABT7AHG1_9HYPH|nr:SDR family NAD(P)-dependent oxidoreductase [Chelatococcus sp. SYSU_G07232]MDJ1158806.1 SDR family NAD(P)-dependent oxidoreductase [Chelatococcus sp. SYSU_G07232]
MLRLTTPQGFKKTLVVVHDLVATAAAVLLAFLVRFDQPGLAIRFDVLTAVLPLFVAYAGIVYRFCGLYRSRWRFASLPDLSNIVRAATVLALTLLVVDYVLGSSSFYGSFFFGKITIALYWVLQMFLLGGARLAYRYLRYLRSRQVVERENTTPTLLIGRASDAEIVLRAVETGAIRKLRVRGILAPRATDLGQSIRGVPVLGTIDDLEQVVNDFAERSIAIRRLVLLPSALSPEAEPERTLARARRLGLPLSRLQSLEEGMRGSALAPVEIEDLLLRPTVEIDRPRLARFIEGKRVVVTGGGGSIGSEICSRVIAFGASDLLVVENSEPALHHVTEEAGAQGGNTRITGVIADIRDRARIERVLEEFKPDVVFHAAALKHVPYLEQDWTEGIKTNVFGSVNVADAAVAAGARALVMISTDKAIEPVSMLGATKRFAEMYAQARDAEIAAGEIGGTRLIAVRFGNVLGSVGSVVPKFKAQIARGGPITVTHPDMVRYFMTIREACDLVLTAASHADGEARRASLDGPGALDRTAVYVLKMGQPVRIYDLAERMIRLAGFEPGVDIEIAVTGMRPGERLHEILFAREEPMAETGIDGIMAAKPIFADKPRLDVWLAALAKAVAREDRTLAEAVMEEAIPDFARRKTAAGNAPAAAAPVPVVAIARAAGA